MRPRNTEGTPVDPVPFLVAAALIFAVSYSFGPMYFVAFGVALPVAVVLSTGVFLAGTGLAYRSLVVNARPEMRSEISTYGRLRRILVITFLVVAALTLAALALSSP